MSLMLLKQSLEILERNSSKDAKNTKEKQVESARAKGKQKKDKRRAELHSTKDRHIVKLKDVKQELNQGEQKSKENLRRLLALSKNTLKEADAQKFVKRAHKGRYHDIELPKREIESIFTEEDFRTFEEEYFKS